MMVNTAVIALTNIYTNRDCKRGVTFHVSILLKIRPYKPLFTPMTSSVVEIIYDVGQ